MHKILDLPEVAGLDARRGIVRIPPELDVPLTGRVRAIIDTAEFRRLARISQLGLVALVYPAALHTRFERLRVVKIIVEQPEASVHQVIHVEHEAELAGLDTKDVGRRVLRALPPTVQPVAKRVTLSVQRLAGAQLCRAGVAAWDESNKGKNSQ